MVKTDGLADKQKAFCQQSPAVRNCAWRKRLRTTTMKGAEQSCVQACSFACVCPRRWLGSRVAHWLSVLLETSSKWSLRTETDVRSVSSGADCIIISVTNSIFQGRRCIRGQYSRYGRRNGLDFLGGGVGHFVGIILGFRVKVSWLMLGVSICFLIKTQ